MIKTLLYTVFPNPSANSINIESNIEIKKIVLSDLLGNILMEEAVNSKQHSVNKTLANGIYMMSVYGYHNELLSSQKITRLN